MLKKTLRGGALYLSVFISLIIAVLLSMLLLHAYYGTVDFQKFTIRQAVRNNLFSAFNYAVSSGFEDTAVPLQMDLYQRGGDSVEIVKKTWGCYKVIGVRAQCKGVSESMLCLTGAAFVKDTALVLTENNRPVSVAGKTLLKGLCLLPKAGVKTAHIEGQSFLGNRLIDGIQLPAPPVLPAPDASIIKGWEAISIASESDSLLNFSNLSETDTIRNSFLSPTLRIVAAGTLQLKDIRLSGNIILQASKKIIIAKSCFLENVLIIAPVVEINEDFTGCLQAIATDTIATGNKVALKYPSSLVIVHKPFFDTATKRMSTPALLIGEKNSIKGTLAACIKDGNSTSNIFLKIKKESEISGFVYSSGYLDLQGSVTGTAMARGLILNTASGVYEQHLLNAVIDRSALSDFFVGGVLFSGKKANKIVKWVN